MEILNQKEILTNTINEIISSYQNRETSHQQECKLFTDENERINTFNQKI